MRTEADAALFGISYLGVADLFSKGTSSPQTTEINAHSRAPTLMKWVNLSAAESAFLIGVLVAAAPPGHKRWPIMGGSLSLAITYTQYVYAKRCGLESTAPGTEENYSVNTPSINAGSPARGRTYPAGAFSGGNR